MNTTKRTSPSIRVVVVDDHPAIQQALTETLKNKLDIVLCGLTGSAREAFALVEAQQPDVAVVDISLEDAHGLELVQNLRAQYPKLQVVIFSMYDEDVYAERAIRAGAAGYVMKSAPTQSVAEAIRSVVRGEVYLSHRMAAHLLQRYFKEQRHLAGGTALTDRERAVFQMLGEGLSVEEITERLNLSRKTVETYRRRAKEKLGLRSVGDLTRYARRHQRPDS